MRQRSTTRTALPLATREGGRRRPDAREMPASSPTPGQAAALSPAKLRAALIHGGRRRGIKTEAARLKAVFAAEQLRRLRQLPMVEEAMAARHWNCCVSWRQRARQPTSWPRPPPLCSASIPTPRPSAAPPGQATSPARGSSPRSAMTWHRFANARALKGLRRQRTRRSGQRQDHPRIHPQGQEPATRCGRLRMGLRHTNRLTTSPRRL